MLKTLARLAVNQCLQIESMDTVTVFFNPYFTKFAEDIAIECFKNGADANRSR